MLQQILNNPDKDFAKAAFAPEARERLRRHLKRSRAWSILGFFIWSLLMAASANSVANEIRATQKASETQTNGPLRVSILMFGLTVIGSAAAVSRWYVSNTELKLLTTIESLAALSHVPEQERAD